MSAVEDVQGSIYVGDSKDEKVQEILFLDFGESHKFTKKIKEGQNLYIKRKFKEKCIFKSAINTGNVLVYVASDEECVFPSEMCYEKFGNIHNPFVYEAKKDSNILFMIKGLDDTEFTLSLIEEGKDFI